jgi:hypothetical protein
MSDSLWTWLKLVTGRADLYDVDVYNYTTQFYWYGITRPEYLMSVIGALIGLFTMTTYLPTAVILQPFHLWYLEIIYCFHEIISKAFQTIGICDLFIPSVIFWGSGFMKDTITLSCMGWVTHFFLCNFYENKKL